MSAVWKRELRSYLKSPVGYVYLFLYLIIAGACYSLFNLASNSSEVSLYFYFSCYIMILTVPILTMKLFPEERKNKTDQILITAPISITKMVLGKFFAAYTMFLISLVPSIFAMGFLYFNGHVETGILVGNYVGILLVGAAYIAIAMLMACVTESQIIAFMMGFFTLLIFAICDILKSVINISIADRIVDVISVSSRFEKLASGLFDFSSIFYFISLTVVFLFLIIRIIDKRRWS
ncbi:MAG: ABC-2 transporter permease [Clostridia bacterium]|nr:ABC-2 transporter permease [Clostridia bacterium]